MVKKNVYLCQCNNTYGRAAFLPYSAGLLQAYAQADPVIRSEYDFRGFVFLREQIPDVIARMERPDVFAASCYIWNWSFSTALARAVKEAFPSCLVVLGGPHVPVKSEEFFREHSYADLLVHYEGEVTFAEVLRTQLNGHPDFTRVPGLSVKLPDLSSLKTPNRPRLDNLDTIPSPYLTGVFDGMIDGKYEYLASSETHRGCPFSCV